MKIGRGYSFLILFSISLISACGGGGGGGSKSAPDTTAPTVSSVAQINAARNVVAAEFSEAMNAATVNTTTFTLADNFGTPISGGVSYSGVTATFTPATQLASSTTYVATISTDVQDLSGNALANDMVWSLVTASGNIQVSWDMNRESAVNRIGGGYSVFYSNTSGFNPGDIGVTEIDVPYISGVSAPLLVQIPFDPGVYYLRIAAYSDLNAPGATGGSASTASPQFMLLAP